MKTSSELDILIVLIYIKKLVKYKNYFFIVTKIVFTQSQKGDKKHKTRIQYKVRTKFRRIKGMKRNNLQTIGVYFNYLKPR